LPQHSVWFSLVLQIAVQQLLLLLSTLTTPCLGKGQRASSQNHSRQRQRRGRTWSLCSFTSSSSSLVHSVTAATNSLSWAAWMALLLTVVETSTSPDGTKWQLLWLPSWLLRSTNNSSNTSDGSYLEFAYTGCICWVALMLYQYIHHCTAVRQRRLQLQLQHLQQQTSSLVDSSGTMHSTSTGTSNNTSSLPDERIWYAWTSRQVLEWMNAYQPPSPQHDYEKYGNDNYNSSNSNYATYDKSSRESIMDHHDDDEHDNDDYNYDNGYLSSATTSVNTVWISCLAAEGLRGTHLDQLVSASTTMTVAQLRRDTGMPYGPAAAFLQAVQDLTRRHQRPTNSNYNHDAETGMAADSTTTTSWLTQHDQEYNHTANAAAAAMATRDNVNGNRDLDLDSQQQQRPHRPPATTIDPETKTRAQSLMTERFGLELPEIRQPRQQKQQSPLHALGANPPRDYGQDTATHSMSEDPLSSSVATANSNNNKKMDPWNDSFSPSSMMGLPPELMASMPPHLAEIIRRKPELVQQILASRQKEQEQQETSRAPPVMHYPQQQSLGGTTNTEQRPPRLGVLAEEEGENEPSRDLLLADNHQHQHEPTRSDDGVDDEWGDNDGERTKLLRNRRRETSQSTHYKSMDK
jgi:hypothetical protein